MTPSEMYDVDPISLMVFIEGQRTIPTGVLAVVACGILLCGLILAYKPWAIG